MSRARSVSSINRNFSKSICVMSYLRS
ncbi:hypothetical protein HOU26_gp73 [Escherichia phage IMM-002]|uniref:Uncharacterized protein n=1 Tax=Escherichia phage IMM-002 TaxID=2041760 RepID=A0A384WIK7_9CAUD|nr:hypothetical protein HOU26_gp73 [Escherichia phage IMM-002]ATI17032.1 hypothetical protein [Escherichia phage IMM-002]